MDSISHSIPLLTTQKDLITMVNENMDLIKITYRDAKKRKMRGAIKRCIYKMKLRDIVKQATEKEEKRTLVDMHNPHFFMKMCEWNNHAVTYTHLKKQSKFCEENFDCFQKYVSEELLRKIILYCVSEKFIEENYLKFGRKTWTIISMRQDMSPQFVKKFALFLSGSFVKYYSPDAYIEDPVLNCEWMMKF